MKLLKPLGGDGEKTGCWIEPRTEADGPQSVPRSLALGGMSDDVTGSDKAARPEVNENTVYLGENHVFFV